MKIFPRFVWPAVTVVLLAGTAAPAQAQDYDPLTLGEALTLIEATKDAGAEMNIRLSIAIVDGRGDLVTMARMEGARPTTADTAIGKAMTSAFTGRPSAATAGSGWQRVLRQPQRAHRRTPAVLPGRAADRAGRRDDRRGRRERRVGAGRRDGGATSSGRRRPRLTRAPGLAVGPASRRHTRSSRWLYTALTRSSRTRRGAAWIAMAWAPMYARRASI